MIDEVRVTMPQVSDCPGGVKSTTDGFPLEMVKVPTNQNEHGNMYTRGF